MDCPVCGRDYVTTWTFEAGTTTDGEDFPRGVGFVHEAAMLATRREYDELGEDAFDGEACRLFVDGTTLKGHYPPQPTVPDGDSQPCTN